MQLPFNLAFGAEAKRLSKLIGYQLSAVKMFYSVILIEYEFMQMSIFGAKEFTQKFSSCNAIN